MPTSGDVVDLDLGVPEGREAGFLHPAVLVTSQRILDAHPAVVHVVPLTTTLRPFHSEIVIEPATSTASTTFPLLSANTLGLSLLGGSRQFAATSVRLCFHNCARPSR